MISCDPLIAGRVNRGKVRDHQANIIVQLLHEKERRKLIKNKSLRKEKRVILTGIAELVTRSHRTHQTVAGVKKRLHLRQLNASDVHLHHPQ